MQALALALIQDSSSQLSSQQTQQLVNAFAGMYVVGMIIFFIVKVVLYTIPMWRICKRAGLSPQLSLLCAIPLIGRLITVYVMAFGDWKVAPVTLAAPLPPPYTPPSYPPAPPSYPSSQPPTS
jgi:hypothetical protein